LLDVPPMSAGESVGRRAIRETTGPSVSGMSEHEQIDLAPIRAKLDGSTGPSYWRSLEELSNTGLFQEYLHSEFPSQAAEFSDPVGRRQFLRLMGASLALAGVGACTKQPPEQIVPYVRAPEEIIPGRPLFFATSIPLGGIATGVLVESHMGRPTKVEGNPDHPASLGATDAFSQAAILSLYDPDRSQALTQAGDIRSWSAFLDALRSAVETRRPVQGRGIRILTETVTSPTLGRQLQEVIEEFPAAIWHQYEPAGRDQVRQGARLAFGRSVDTHYAVDKARVILSLGSDFLSSGPGAVRYARDFAAGRRVRGTATTMSRLYVAESTPTNTGAKADHRLPVRPRDIEALAVALAAAAGVQVPATPTLDPAARRWLDVVIKDALANKGASLIAVGDEQPAIVHALAHEVNQALGNVGSTVIHTEPVEVSPIDQTQSLQELAADMNAGRVEVLLILGGNPVYNAPCDLRLGDGMTQVGFSAHLSLYEDETSARCTWHIPEAHVLESWGDSRAWDGTVSLTQPLIAPLYGGRSASEVLGAMSGTPARSPHNLVHDFWTKTAAEMGVADPEAFWRRSVADGVVAGTALQPLSVSVSGMRVPALPSLTLSSDLDVVFRTDPTIHDGRFANNGWLQELPKPLTKLTWDNTIQVSPATGARLGVRNEDLAELRSANRTVTGPVWIVPGQADNTVVVHLGYGRTRAGHVGNAVGFNAYSIRTSGSPWASSSAVLVRTGARYPLASTQLHHNMEGRAIVRAATIGEYSKDPRVLLAQEPEPPRTLTMYKEHEYKGYAWGMAIDLNSCIGCNACVVACQAENNVPIVGKEQVAKGREMHWIRVDTYYEGGVENPETYHQPVMCQQCENAPCELVCPVGATVHSDEGLNDMVYNRCVGTRYCSNNCPYKVRRFNFLLYQDFVTPSLKMARNPDVTVRSRGVMEKCTYCVQRINHAKIDAEKEGRLVRDGDITTACEGSCPAQAIVFGNINDPESRVSKLRAETLSYSLLGELNTRPRTTYLGALRNPNPDLLERDAEEKRRVRTPAPGETSAPGKDAPR
jgi:MoCo/4Fe-4S cofactor protein with predicted Tat translocation signal